MTLIASVSLNVWSLYHGLRLKGPQAGQARSMAALTKANDVLIASGFEVSIVSLPSLESRFGLDARRGSCALILTPVDPFGWSEALLTRLASSASLTYVTRMGPSIELPVAYTAIDAYTTFLLQRLGFPRTPATVFAVLSNGACDLHSVDWKKLY